jgi:hypothetical protein
MMVRSQPKSAAIMTAAMGSSRRSSVTGTAARVSHLAAELLLAEIIIVNWVILLVLNGRFFFTLPFELHPAPGVLPTWLWDNVWSGLLLGAANSVFWGVCLGVLLSKLWTALWRRHSLSSPLVAGSDGANPEPQAYQGSHGSP